jgi:hypothetical protein
MSKDLLPTNDNQENFDQIHADNEIKRIGFALNEENKIISFPRQGHLKTVKTCRDPYLDSWLCKSTKLQFISWSSPFKRWMFVYSIAIEEGRAASKSPH